MIDLIFIVYWSMTAFVTILIWLTEFSGWKFKSKKKSEWQKSKERVKYQVYKEYDYSAHDMRNRPYNLRK